MGEEKQDQVLSEEVQERESEGEDEGNHLRSQERTERGLYNRQSREELPEGWEERVFELSQKGFNEAELLDELRITETTHSLFQKESVEYTDIFERCKVLHDSYWHRIFRENINKSSFNTNGWIAYMRNNCGYQLKGEGQKGGRTLRDKLGEEHILNQFKREEGNESPN